MPSRVHQLLPQHVEDALDHGFAFTGLGTSDNISTFTVTVPAEITQPYAATKSGQTVTVWIQGSAGTHRIIVDVVSDAGREARIEADIVISDPA